MIKHSTALTLAALAAASVVVSSASGSSGSRTIHLTEAPSHFAFVDVAPKGGPQKPPTEGDEFVIGGRLGQNGKRLGTSNLVCTVTQPGSSGLSQCVGTLVLPHGDITLSGVSRIASNSDRFAVTGGTGAYARATGVVSSKQARGDDDALTVSLGR